MMHARMVLGVLLVVAALAGAGQASTVEEATARGVAYQFDAGSHHDAPDACDAAAPGWSLPLDASTDGLLLAPDDVSDAFLLEVPADGVGSRLGVRVQPAAGTPDLDLTVFYPGCAGDVFDAMNQPAAPPAPPASGSGEAQSSVQNPDGDWRCDATQWFFIANQLDGAAPPSIHAAWTDGTQQAVPLLHFTNSTAHYAVSGHVEVTLKGAWINLPAPWQGNFRIGAGPCDAVDGGAVYGQPPVAGLGFISFTPLRSGPFVVQVTYDTPAGTLTDFLADPPAPPGPMTPRTCHFCFREVEDAARLVSYRLVATRS